MDAYEYAAGRLDAETMARIDAFWMAFAGHADALDSVFTDPQGRELDVPGIVRAALDPVSEDLMWEFGPSDRGHALTVTAEWQDELRPLATALINRAPDLPRWRFHDVRQAEPVDQIAGIIEARLRKPLAIDHVEVTAGEDRTVWLTVSGQTSEDDLEKQAILLFSLLTGEAQDRIWLGQVDARQRRKGLFGRAKKAAALDLEQLRKSIVDCIDGALGLAPDRPFGEQPLDDREISLLEPAEPGHGPAPRDDVIVLSSAHPDMLLSQLNSPRFSSQRFSRFGETFATVKITRPEGGFNQVSERSELEEKIHHALAASQTGGVVGGAHGTGHVYVDIALQDIGGAVSVVIDALKQADIAGPAWIMFVEPGLDGFSVPVWPGSPPPPRPDLQ